MKNKIKMRKITVSLIVLIALILVVIGIQANFGIKSEIIADKKELREGENITITFKLKNDSEYINCYKATLEYDKETFEEINENDIKSKNSWEELEYNKETGEFIAINKEKQVTGEEIAQITLKVKEGATAKKTNIIIKEIEASGRKSDLQIEQANLLINIIEDEKPEEQDIITSSKYEIGKDYIITKVSPETTVNEFKENITTKKEMELIDKNGNILTQNDIITTGTKLKLDKNIEYTIIVTGDLNGDGKITVTDLAQLKLHCIEKQTLTNNALKAADINSDGNVTVTDLAQIKLKLLDKI